MSASDNNLCLSCGLCCNGVLFADVRLQAGDGAIGLRGLGLPVEGRAGREKFKQPCPALNGCRCRIYGDRPHYCREFECLLLKRVVTGEIQQKAAMDVIKETVEKVRKLKEFFTDVGDKDEHVPLRRRFQEAARKKMDRAAADLFAEASLIFHELNLVLEKEFYPSRRQEVGDRR